MRTATSHNYFSTTWAFKTHLASPFYLTGPQPRATLLLIAKPGLTKRKLLEKYSIVKVLTAILNNQWFEYLVVKR